MAEVSGTVKHFLVSINQQFPGGALFLLLSDNEFHKVMMDLTNSMMEHTQDQLFAARIIGKNTADGNVVWVMSEKIQIGSDGRLLMPCDTPFLWLRKLVNGTNVLLQESLACKIATPLDEGESLHELCFSIKKFMPENFMAAMAVASACIMGANYTSILSMFGCCGVPLLSGPPGSCKSEATKCSLALYGAHETHSCNNLTTPSYLFKAASQTTVPICVDDINEKAADSWEELVIDAYNGMEYFKTLPILTANWKIDASRPRAHSRVIQIPFQQHEDEPEANILFSNMSTSRDAATKSIGQLVQLSTKFEKSETKEYINQDISPFVSKILSQFSSPARFTTTMSVFMYFFIEVSFYKLHGSYTNIVIFVTFTAI